MRCSSRCPVPARVPAPGWSCRYCSNCVPRGSGPAHCQTQQVRRGIVRIATCAPYTARLRRQRHMAIRGRLAQTAPMCVFRGTQLKERREAALHFRRRTWAAARLYLKEEGQREAARQQGAEARYAAGEPAAHCRHNDRRCPPRRCASRSRLRQMAWMGLSLCCAACSTANMTKGIGSSSRG